MSPLKLIAGALVLVCLFAIGCSGGNKEVKPTTEGAKVVPDAAKKGMEESFKHMSPQMQEQLKGQLNKAKQG